MFAKSLILVLLCVGIGIISSEDTPQFSFYDYFQGDWDVQRTVASFKTGEQTHDDLLAHYTIEKENGTLNLIGKYFMNDTTTGDITNLIRVVIDFNVGGNSGAFKTGSIVSDMSEDEDEEEDDVKDHSLKTLFNFDFSLQHNGMVVSQGEWFGTEASSSTSTPTSTSTSTSTTTSSSSFYYQFLIGGWDKFSITVYPKSLNQDAEIVLFTGRKIPVLQEKGFFQKYGTMMMIGGFFLFNMFVQKKTRSMQENQQRRPANNEGGAQIEEVQEEPAATPEPPKAKEKKKQK